jgi:two-component system, NtrC family, sensor kinase
MAEDRIKSHARLGLRARRRARNKRRELMAETQGFPASPPAQERHSVARWPWPRSLRGRLLSLVLAAGIVIVGSTTWFELQTFERAVESDIERAAVGTAESVVDVLEVGSVDDGELTGMLHEFMRAMPAARAISVVSLDGEPAVRASTSSSESPRVIEACRTAATSRQPAWIELAPDLRVVAVPGGAPTDRPWAVAVTASLGAVTQARQRGGRVAIWFALLAMVLLIGVVDLFFRRLVHVPLSRVRETMVAAGRGELDARVPVERPDEIGELSASLNRMLALLESLTRDLNERVRAATSGLQHANMELISSRQRVLALRQALARAEQLAAVGHMAANLAHEVGTPLNLVSGYVQMLLEDADREPRSAERLRIVRDQIARITGILRSVLDRARRPAESKPTDVAAAWRRVFEVAQPTLDAAHITMEAFCPPEIPLVLAEAAELELVLQNLVANSVDAMPGGGHLTLRIVDDDSEVRLELTDTGTGIAPDLLAHVFEPWVTTKPPGSGTGLGLSICREIVSRHGGRLTVSSEPGKGATFTVALRRATPEIAIASSSSSVST